MQLDSKTAIKVEKDINKAIEEFKTETLPDTNNPDLQNELFELWIGKILANIGKKLVDPNTKAFKTVYAQYLDTEGQFELDRAGGFKLMAKVTAARSSFDKDAFIEEIANRYGLNRTELVSLSQKTVKKSANPVSLNAEITD